MKKLINIFIIFLFAGGVLQAQNVKIADLSATSFKQKVWNFDKEKKFKRIGNTPIILDFHATWCGPCKMLAPHLQRIQNKYKGKLIVYKIDVDKEPDLASMFGIEYMPTIIFIDSPNSYKKEIGYKDYDEFESIVKKYFFTKK